MEFHIKIPSKTVEDDFWLSFVGVVFKPAANASSLSCALYENESETVETTETKRPRRGKWMVPEIPTLMM